MQQLALLPSLQNVLVHPPSKLPCSATAGRAWSSRAQPSGRSCRATRAAHLFLIMRCIGGALQASPASVCGRVGPGLCRAWPLPACAQHVRVVNTSANATEPALTAQLTTCGAAQEWARGAEISQRRNWEAIFVLQLSQLGHWHRSQVGCWEPTSHLRPFPALLSQHQADGVRFRVFSWAAGTAGKDGKGENGCQEGCEKVGKEGKGGMGVMGSRPRPTAGCGPSQLSHPSPPSP